jgi:hypothetical protein
LNSDVDVSSSVSYGLIHFPRESSKRSREKCRGFSSAVAPHRHQPSREKPYAIMCTTILWKPVTPENGPGMCSCKRAEFVDDIMAGSFTIRQSKTILARSVALEKHSDGCPKSVLNAVMGNPEMVVSHR